MNAATPPVIPPAPPLSPPPDMTADMHAVMNAETTTPLVGLVGLVGLAAVVIAIGLPLLAATAQLAGGERLRSVSRSLAPWLPLILLWPALAHAGGTFPWSVLGAQLVADDVARPLLILVAVAWSAAGWHATRSVTKDRRWFWTAWFGALGGMSLLLLAGDVASFYLGYVIVSLSGYLLVTQPRSDEAWRAGRIYLVMAFAGEAAILVGLLLLAGTHGNAALSELASDPTMVFETGARWWLFAGFAVKLGIVPLHVWLPLAHPVAPVPASAVLSGVIVKAGLLGWLRFVPASGEDPRAVGTTLLAIGLVTAFGGVLLGLGQRRLKTVLAYSTISQMGLVLAGFSATFLATGRSDAALAVLGIVALHHGLNKAALFVACGCAPGNDRVRLALFAIPALSLAAAPLTTGFLAKTLLKETVSAATVWPAIPVVLSLTSTATALLMWKAFGLARRQTDTAVGLHPAWPLLVVAALTIPWVYAFATGHATAVLAGAPIGKLIDSVWPLGLAALLIVVTTPLLRGRRLEVPEGDVVVVVERAVERWSNRGDVVTAIEAKPDRDADSIPDIAASGFAVRLLHAEQVQRRIAVVGLGLLVIGGLLWLLTLFGGG